jgi:hypothetical protein
MAAGTHELVEFSGPLLEGRAPIILDEYMKANLALIANLAEDAVQQELDVVLQNPTGFYRSQISSTVRSGVGRTLPDVVVHDSGVIYGPWLAGTGSRNAPVTRFKGYTHWRKASQRMEKLAHQTVISTFRQLIHKLGD